MVPGDWYEYFNLGWAHAAAGRVEPAIAAFREAQQHTTDNSEWVSLGLAYAFARGNQRDSSFAHLAHIDEATASYDYSLVLFELGETDRAFAALETSLRRESVQLPRMKDDPTAARMLSDRRFAELTQRLGLDRQ